MMDSLKRTDTDRYGAEERNGRDSEELRNRCTSVTPSLTRNGKTKNSDGTKLEI